MIESLIPAALYAETHFRFGGWTPSALFRDAPEIVFDFPRRVEKGRSLPAVLLINDVHLYPISIESVQITISQNGADFFAEADIEPSKSLKTSNSSTHNQTVASQFIGKKPLLFEFDRQTIQKSAINHPFIEQMEAYILTVSPHKLPKGEVFVNACLRYRRVKNGRAQKKIYAVLNDNLVTSTKFSYRCVISDDTYPGGDLCTYGDVHCHSQFSRSHVEWGPPIEVIDKMASASGLNFVAITDHSYDLACTPDNFLRQDKDLRLWKTYISTVGNFSGETLFVSGEEVSVLNSKNKVVHLGALGISKYISGTLDGARKNIHHNKQLTIEEAVDEIERQGGISFAAHPGAKAGLFQSLFLKRGTWKLNDMSMGLGGVQAVSGDFFELWNRGKDLWLSMLQRGSKIPILAGSDAHGDFNRYRAIGAPFIQIYENAERYMGSVRTGVYGKLDNVKDVMLKIKDAATFVTNGPFVSVCNGYNPKISLIGSQTITDTTNLRAQACSTEEFGTINTIKVILGDCGENISRSEIKGTARTAKGETPREKTIINQTLPSNTFETTIPIPQDALSQNCYLRVEVYGKNSRNATIAATSACFI